MSIDFEKLNKEGRLLILPPVAANLNDVTNRKYGAFPSHMKTTSMCLFCPLYCDGKCPFWDDKDCYIDRKEVLDLLNSEAIEDFPE